MNTDKNNVGFAIMSGNDIVSVLLETSGNKNVRVNEDTTGCSPRPIRSETENVLSITIKY